MKALLVIFAIVVLAVAGLYFFTDLSSFDPAAQAAEIRQNVKPGMTWEQVVEVRAPVKFEPVNSEAFNGRRQSQKFNREQFAAAMEQGHYPEGFVFPYMFSDAHAIEVIFDEDGKVSSLQKPPTFSDLLQ